MRLLTKKQEVKFLVIPSNEPEGAVIETISGRTENTETEVTSAISDDEKTETKANKRRIFKRRNTPGKKVGVGLVALILVIAMCLGFSCGGYFAYKKYQEDQLNLQNTIQSNYNNVMTTLDKQKNDTDAAVTRLTSSMSGASEDLYSLKVDFETYKNDAKTAYDTLQSSVYYVKGKGSYTSVYYTYGYSYWYGFYSIPNYYTVNYTQTGTGFLIAPDGILVTNHHVVEDLSISNISIADVAGKEYTDLELIGVDYNNDLAIIKVHGLENAPYLELSPLLGAEGYHNIVGAHTYTLGYPAGYIMFSDGLVSSDIEYQSFDSKPEVHVFKITNNIGTGSSGGPVMSEGKVIGICVGKYASNQVDNLNWALTIGPLYSLIRMISDEYPSLSKYSSDSE
jgi:S1-C subfamily serine protease